MRDAVELGRMALQTGRMKGYIYVPGAANGTNMAAIITEIISTMPQNP